MFKKYYVDAFYGDIPGHNRESDVIWSNILEE